MTQISKSLGKENIGLLDEEVPGNEGVLGGRWRRGLDRTSKRSPGWESQAALAMAERTGVTEACFCGATEGQPLSGDSSRVPARGGTGSRVLAEGGL